MAERRVSVRLAAVGGDRLKADLVAIGREGKAALAAIAGGSAPASHGLAETSAAARTLVTRLEAVSARAGAAAATMRGLEAAGGVVARIDRSDRGHRRPPPRRRRHRGLWPGARRHPGEVQPDVRGGEELPGRARGDPGGACHRRDLGRRDERGDRPDKDRLARLIAAIKGRTTAIGQMASGSRLAAMQSRMLLFQLNDIGVSLAGGMNPLMVLVQQGSQITQMYAGAGGVNAALRQTADLAKGAVTGAGNAARGVLGLARARQTLWVAKEAES